MQLMKVMQLTVALTVGTVCQAQTPAAAAPQDIGPKVGDVAPDFKLKNHCGQEVQLSKLKGKAVVLWFYPKADTPG